ncbi:MAG: FHA domain-containing protein, partial [Bdellovibrionota bacterium]
MKQPVFLRVYLNGKLENVKQFTEEQIVIGRNADLQLSLHEDTVSPLHAVIEERDTGYYISDLGSQAGTFKNGQKVFDDKIESGEEFTIGSYKIEFFVGVPKPKAPPPKSTPTETVIPVAPVVAAAPPVEDTDSMEMPDEPPPPTKEEKKGFAFTPGRSTKEIKPKTVNVGPVPTSNESVQRLSDTLKSSKGSIVEVIVAWKDRVLTTSHFSHEGEVTIGGDSSTDIQIPLIGVPRIKHPLLKLGPGVRVRISAEMSGDYYKDGTKGSIADLKRMNRMMPSEAGFEFDLLQGEMVRLGMHGDVLNIYIRFIPDVPKPIGAPFLDLTASETASVIMSVLVAGFFALYMSLYSPSSLDGKDNLLEEPIRRATVTFNPPKIVQVTETPEPQEKKVVQVVEKKAQQAQTTKKDPGKASDMRPSERVAKKGEV